MSPALTSGGLGENGDMLPSRVTADQEKDPQGGEGKILSVRPGRLSPPGVWRGRGAQRPSRRAGGAPPHPLNSSNLLLSTTIIVTPWPQASYSGKINGKGRSNTHLWRLGAGTNIQEAQVLFQGWRVCAASVDGVWVFPSGEHESTLQPRLIWSGQAPLSDKQVKDK